MRHRDIIVIGTSAGGVEALRSLASGLPSSLRASIFVVMHVGLDSPGLLAQIIDNAGPLPAGYAEDGKEIEEGRIYVAPADCHLLLERGKIRLSRGPKENLFRPAIDPLFRSAAQIYKDRVIGVILTGGLDDGTSGLQSVKTMSGLAVVQDPKDAFAPSMPASALRHVSVDYCLPVQEIAALLTRLVNSPIEEKESLVVPKDLNTEVAIANGDNAIHAGVEDLGRPSLYACPECHGVLLHLHGSKPERFRCHVGHAYSVSSLVVDQAKRIDEALWTATRAIEESMLFLGHLVEHPDELPVDQSFETLSDQIEDMKIAADKVRDALAKHAPLQEQKANEP